MKNAGEEYSVRCQVFENHEPLIDLTLSVPTEKEAAAIALNWQKKKSSRLCVADVSVIVMDVNDTVRKLRL